MRFYLINCVNKTILDTGSQPPSDMENKWERPNIKNYSSQITVMEILKKKIKAQLKAIPYCWLYEIICLEIQNPWKIPAMLLALMTLFISITDHIKLLLLLTLHFPADWTMALLFHKNYSYQLWIKQYLEDQ